jgi:hypothetical protein
MIGTTVCLSACTDSSYVPAPLNKTVGGEWRAIGRCFVWQLDTDCGIKAGLD